MRPRDTFVDVQQLDEDYDDLRVQLVPIEKSPQKMGDV